MGDSSKPERRFAFTKTTLESLTAPVAGRDVYSDSRTPGLILRITPAGSKSFYFYRKVKGRPVRMLLGKFPEISVENARKACQATSGKIALGKDPQAERCAARHEQTIGGLFSFWLETHAKQRKRTWKEDERQYNTFIKAWANRKLSAIKKTDMQALHARVGEKSGRYAANRLLALLRAMFNKAPDMGFAGSNPTMGIKKFQEEKRDRFLHGDDLRVFFTALGAEPNADLRDFFIVCLFVGAENPTCWPCNGKISTSAPEYGGSPKPRAGNRLWFPSPVRSYNSWQHAGTLRTARRGSFRPAAGPATSWSLRAAWKRIITRAGLKDVRPHDLRRSLGSWMAMTGSSLPVVGKMLGHTQPATTAIYARLAVDPIRQAAETAVDAMRKAGGITLENVSETGSNDEP